MKTSKVAVIGAGLGGLSAAISLRAAGYQVEVFEKNEKIGGKLNLFEKDGFTFDLGPSIFTLPQFFRDLFERAEKRMEDYVQLDAVTPHWRNFFEKGPSIDLYQENELMKGELAKLPGDLEKNWAELQSFLDYGRKQYSVVSDGYFKKGLDNLWEFIKHYKLGLMGGKIDYRATMSESIAKRLSDPKLRMIFEYFIKYVGSSALQAPGYMNLMPIIQYDYGLWYVRGGMYQLANGLGKLMEEMDITVHLNADVQSITKEGKKVTSVNLADGTSHAADIIVSNMEVIPAYQKLLNEPSAFTQKLDKKILAGLLWHRSPYRNKQAFPPVGSPQLFLF